MKKKNVFLVLLLIVAIIAISIFVVYKIDMKRMENNQPILFSTWGYDYASPVENVEGNVVIIKDGKINNEDLIEKFINETDIMGSKSSELIIREYNSESNFIDSKLSYISNNVSEKESVENDMSNQVVNLVDGFGKFVFVENYNNWNAESKDFNALYYDLKRRTEDGIITLYFYSLSSLNDEEREFDICSYSLESSNYTNKITLEYKPKDDMKLELIVDKNDKNFNYDFNIYTLGGDVYFMLDNYKDTLIRWIFKAVNLGETLEGTSNLINNILEQADIDAKYGICRKGIYSDGGSVEYCYDNYTILKFNTLDGNKDFVIGGKGPIINKVTDLL